MSGLGDRLNQRKKDFKKGIDSDDARRKREDAAVQLRKQVREEALEKKRMTSEGNNGDSNGMAMMGTGGAAEGHIVELANAVASQNADEQFQAVQQLRKCLSVENNPPIQEVIHTGVVPRLVELLKDISRPELQFEAEWVLTNIASGNADQTRVVVEAGALPLFIQLLQSPNPDVQEQAVWALGNIAGDSSNLRDLVLHSGGLFPVMAILQSATDKQSMMRNATWTLSNLCRGKPPPPFEAVAPALTVLSALLNQTDEETLTDACWAFSYLSDGPNERITGVIQAGVVPRLVQLLEHPCHLVQTPALRAVGNIVTGDDEQTQTVLRNNVTIPLLKLLKHEKKNIKKEACWTISNITAGSKEQIQEVIDKGLIPAVIELLSVGDFDIKKEAAWVISNASAGGSAQQIEYLVTSGCLRPMIDLLSTSDVKVITVALEALEHILQCGKNSQATSGLAENPVVKLIEEADGISKIEALQEDPTEEIYSKAMQILEKFFPIEDGDDVETDAFTGGFGAAAQIPQGGFNFNFGGTQTPAFSFS